MVQFHMKKVNLRQPHSLEANLGSTCNAQDAVCRAPTVSCSWQLDIPGDTSTSVWTHTSFACHWCSRFDGAVPEVAGQCQVGSRAGVEGLCGAPWGAAGRQRVQSICCSVHTAAYALHALHANNVPPHILSPSRSRRRPKRPLNARGRESETPLRGADPPLK